MADATAHAADVPRLIDGAALDLKTNNHPVLELMQQRRSERSLPGKRTDDAKLALVVEGGGMRATVSGGMVVALEQLGLTNVFDRIYGASGGLFNACYLMAGQGTFGSTIYAEDLTTKRFVDFRRLVPSIVKNGPPVVSVDYAIDEVMTRRRPVDWQAVVDSPIELHPIASSIKPEYGPIDLGVPRDVDHLRSQLLASSRVMILGGPPYEIDGHSCFDASLFMGIPYQFAVDQGATHVLALLTRPHQTERKGGGAVEKFVVSPLLRRIDRRLPQTMKDRIETYRSTVALLERATADPAAGPVPTFAVQTQGAEISQLEQDPRVVMGGSVGGMEAVFALTGRDVDVVPTLNPYGASI